MSKAVSVLVAATAGIYGGFRARAKWEPCEEDLPKTFQKIGLVIPAVGIAILLTVFADLDPEQNTRLIYIAIALLTVCVVSFLFYITLHVSCTFENSKAKKFISGLRLTETARSLKSQGLSRSEILKKCRFEKEKIWTYRSCVIAQLLFVIAYLSLTSSGTLALASGGLLISGSRPIRIKVTVSWEDSPKDPCPVLLIFDFEKERIPKDTVAGTERTFFLSRTHDHEIAKIRATCGTIAKTPNEEVVRLLIEDNASGTVPLRSIDHRVASKLILDGYEALAGQNYDVALANVRLVLKDFPNDPEAQKLEFKVYSELYWSRGNMHSF